ncbi:MAG: hypothetical protein AAFQ43_03165 [Bacteroidota bacterium]
MRLATLALVLLAAPVLAQEARDGHLFDQGRAMADRSERADAELDRMKGLLGAWDVTVTTHPTDSTTHTAEGQAEIAYMNRGYAYQERRHVPGYSASGEADHAMSFLVYAPSTGTWGLGEGRSSTETVEIYTGAPEASGLALHTATRRLGGMALTHVRTTYALASGDGFTVTVEEKASGDWRTVERRVYSRRTEAPDLLATAEHHGSAAAGLPPEAREFDFLIGTWDAAHRLNLGGNWVQFPTTTTAVFALGGHAVLEHSWFDLDPSLPDASTTILRLYNRAERRWESLYMANRGNTLLKFGSDWEGDRMVLHTFEARRTDPISRFVFHSIEPDAYAWFAESSTDGGATFAETWTIDVTRRPAP